MELLTDADFRRLSNPGVVSVQLVSQDNASSARVTVTMVTIQPGAVQPRHSHASSEQIWIGLAGSGKLLAANGDALAFNKGNVARFAEGEVHGFENTSCEPFTYLAITAPPIDFSYAYKSAQ